MRLFLFSLLHFVIFSASAGDINQNDYFIEKRGTFTYPMFEADVNGLEFYRKLNNGKRINQSLGTIKFYMINGNLEKAKLMLISDNSKDKYAQVIKYRYLSMIYFIQGEYDKSLEYLTKKEMLNLSYTKNLCLLRTMNYLILDKAEDAAKDWNRCVDATLTQSDTEHVWMSTLVNLKLTKDAKATTIPFKSINIENETGRYLKLFLKLSLYLGQQQKILERLKFLNPEVYTDPEIRELVGMLYYREGKIVKAYQFIEDLTSPNSQNIKGNIYLSQEKYELAYAQFKLALQKKINSQNSIERMIPLAWTLKQWQDGIDYISKLENKTEDKYKKLTVLAAFKASNGSHKESANDLERIVVGSRNSQSPEVNKLYSFNAMMLNDLDKAQTYADLSCKNQDGFNCWMQFHLEIWENFTLTTNREDKVISEENNLTNRLIASVVDQKIDEEVYINQKDIEELDNELIKLQNEQQ